MKEKILELLGEHSENCGDNRGRNDGEYLSNAVDKIIELIKRLPEDAEIDKLKKDSIELSWLKHPDRMGQ